MAVVTLHSTGRRLISDPEICSFLAPHGIEFERWPVPPRVVDIVSRPALSDEEKSAVLAGFSEQLQRLADTRGYVNSDMVVLHPATPGLDAALAKFDKVHFHTDEEVRFIVDGRGIFGFVGQDGEKFEVQVQAGEYIVVPAHSWHWFTLCEDRRIKAIRLFQDMSGWTPHYVDDPAQENPRG